jgi:hypothetical protein
MKKCSQMILNDQPTLKPDADALNDTDPADLPFIKFREQNATAFSMLSLSTKGRSHVAVQARKTTKHPSGYARKAWLNLKTLNKQRKHLIGVHYIACPTIHGIVYLF